ncbi:hypothetical protein E4191_16515 (plasmid) [Paracoccus liaowanqingii]|uniref:Uncharacterized protein n=1 Tax=Paracoccus liaowanqingii TaxID=2560053 RepID=A0A4Y5SS26_9RHOB|nr:hypothetical protein [Paracoccus liaowanqingii]QDA35768.1 hypothetical protein E4191_16515 [Paracoccus liaowanqingii]
MSSSDGFEQSDWQGLSGADQDTLRVWLQATIDLQPLAKAAGVDQESKGSMIAQGLAVEDNHAIYGYTLNLTDKGWLAIEWLSRNDISIPLYGSFESQPQSSGLSI